MAAKLREREAILLEIVRRSDRPLGSWNLVELLSSKGINLSASTVGRLLNQLERRGCLSKKNCNQGRTITSEGAALLDLREREQALQPLSEQLGSVIHTNVLETYLQVLEARKVIERATARLAARNISEGQL